MAAIAIEVEVETPWMSAREAAVYAGRHYVTVRKALLEFVHSGGKRGLKGYQRKAHASWRIHRDDVDRWIQGPAARARRAEGGGMSSITDTADGVHTCDSACTTCHGKRKKK